MKNICIIMLAILIAGCSAQPLKFGAEKIELVNEAPDRSRCRFIAEIIGSQGNWVTGDFTTNKDLMLGARNDLRNKAHKLGADIVYVQDSKNTKAQKSLGTTNTIVVGNAYKCD